MEDERQLRLAAEADRDSFAKQLDMLKDILLSDGNRGGFDNETLERVRHIDTTKRNSPFKVSFLVSVSENVHMAVFPVR